MGKWGKWWNWVRALFLSGEQWRALRPCFFWAAASGALLRLPFPPFEWGGVAFFALAPFLAQLPGRSPKEGAWLGLVFGYVFFQLNMLWLNNLTDVNPMAPLGIAAAALVFCAPAMALFGGVTAWLSARAPRRRALWITPALWVAIEYLRAQSELGFPWMYLGHTQVTAPPLIQICDLTGVYGVSFLLALINQVISEAWLFARCRRNAGAGSGEEDSADASGAGSGAAKIPSSIPPPQFPGGTTHRAWREGAGAAILITVLFIAYGKWRLAEDRVPAARPFRAGIVQVGLPQRLRLAACDYTYPGLAERLQRVSNRRIADEIEAIAREAAGEGVKPDLVVLPESAVLFPFFSLSEKHVQMTLGWAASAGAPLFFGADRFVAPPGVRSSSDPRFYEEGRMHNSAFLAEPGRERLSGYYDKMHLVPFGEYGSYLDFIPGFTNMILGIGNMVPGDAPKTFEAGGRKFGALICFESCFPYLFRQYPEADFFVVITNDAWYKLSSGARRHQTQSIFRAIETRRPVVRASATGISCVIDSRGRALASLPLDETKPGHLLASVPLPGGPPPATLYMRPWGDWFSWLCLALSAGSVWRFRGSGKGKPA